MTIKVRFDGRAFVPDEPVNLPPGTTGEIVLDINDPTTKRPLLDLLDIIDRSAPSTDQTLPADLASQHDHYLYGTPKRP